MATMSDEQIEGLEKITKSVCIGLDVFQATGRRGQFIAISDQIDAYKEEFNAEFDIILAGKKIF